MPTQRQGMSGMVYTSANIETWNQWDGVYANTETGTNQRDGVHANVETWNQWDGVHGDRESNAGVALPFRDLRQPTRNVTYFASVIR